jgi:maleylpyruvate isomerase
MGCVTNSDTGAGLPYLDDVLAATARYVEALTELDDAELYAPSLLPGWTRAHVVTHVARNADASVNALLGAAAGELRAMYESQEQRDAEVVDGADRPAAELRADAEASSQRWADAARALPEDRLDAPVLRTPGGERWTVRRLGAMRRREVEIHHADLGIGYTADQWPADLVDLLLAERLGDLAAAGRPLVLELSDRDPGRLGEEGPTVSGTAAAAVWWLLGRGANEGLACSDGRLPDIGRWR